jgi:hypothetical protein
MNPDLDPMNVSNKPAEVVTTLVETTTKVENTRPRNLPELLNTFVKPDTIGGDLCRYFVFPAIENGLHKAASALLGYFVLGQKIAPSNGKSNGVYIYEGGKTGTDYTVFSSGKTQATIIDSNGVSHVMTGGHNTSGKMSTFRLQHFADDDILKVNPIPWTWGDVEAKQEHMNDVLGDAIMASQWASVQEVCDAAGISGVPPTANKWGWKDISRMSVQIDPDDNTVLVIRMGTSPQPIT